MWNRLSSTPGGTDRGYSQGTGNKTKHFWGKLEHMEVNYMSTMCSTVWLQCAVASCPRNSCGYIHIMSMKL